jgi:Mg-chelatase subunit ChlD
MARPTLTETAPGSDSYDITDSRAFISNFDLDINPADQRSFTVAYPATAATGLIATIQRTAPAPASVVVDLLTVPGGSGVEVGNYQITVDKTPPIGGIVQLTCTLTNNGFGGVNETWELRFKATDPVTWRLSTSDAANVKRNFVACDPRSVLATPAANSALLEGDVTLAADNAMLNTVLGTLPASLAPGYRWQYDGPIAITDFPRDTAVSSFTVPMPGVYDLVPITLTVKTAFGGTDANDTTGFLESVSETVAATIKGRPQHLVLVLDRSGSMADENRWETAITASRVLTHLFTGVREGVNPDDRIGIVAFEDDQCTWRDTGVSRTIQTLLPMTPLDKAANDISTLNFGLPGGCTPIGDGLVAGLDLLGDEGPIGDKKFTVVVMTDGFENSGRTFVGPNDPSVGAGLPPGTVDRFSTLAPDAAHPRRLLVRDTARKFIVGLGATVETDVLSNLATASGGQFSSAKQASELVDDFANILHFSQEVNQALTSNTPPAGVPANPDRVYFTTATGAERLAFAVLRTGLAATEESIRLDRWDPTTSTFVAQPVDVQSSTTHHAATVPNLINVTAGGSAIWRVTSVDATDAPLAPLPAANVLAYEDLRVKAAVELSQPAFLTGDDMTVTVRVRHDNQPIRGATIRATLDAPTQGVGEALSTLGPNFVPKVEKGLTRRDAPPRPAAMIEEVLRLRGWKAWPHTCPKGLFADGTDVLHDPDGDGNYTNTFDRVWKEGVYGWNLIAEGIDAAGNPFSRRLAITTVAGVKVDPKATRIRLQPIDKHPSGLRAVRVIITPQDIRGERLGPNKDNVVIWALEEGSFEHIVNHQPAPVFTDGTYQRVVLFRPSQDPTLRVKASGTLLPRIKVRGSSHRDSDDRDKRAAE